MKLKTAAQAWQERDTREIYEWAAENINLPSSGYAISGRFNVELSPWLKRPFEAIKDQSIRQVNCRKAVQTAGSLISDITLPWIVCNSPAPIMLTMQTRPDVKDHMESRIQPMLTNSPSLRNYLPADMKTHFTAHRIFFTTCNLFANSATKSSLQSKSIRWKINDEIWAWEDQSLIDDAKKRTRAYEKLGNSKIINISQCGFANDAEDTEFRRGTQHDWWTRCPSCKHEMPLEVRIDDCEEGIEKGGLVFDKQLLDNKDINIPRAVETVRYRCPHCGHEMDDSQRTRTLWKQAGFYKEQIAATPLIHSFRWNALVDLSFQSIIGDFCFAYNEMRRGIFESMIKFKQKTEAMPWVEKKEVEQVEITIQASDEPIEGGTNICTIDKQQGHYWVEVRNWNANQPVRQLYFGQVAEEEEIGEILTQHNVSNNRVFIDRGYKPDDVDQLCAANQWFGMKGATVSRMWRQKDRRTGLYVERPYGHPTKSRHGGYWFEYNANIAKDILFAKIKASEWTGSGNTIYGKHLAAEEKKESMQGKWEWRKKYQGIDNHGLDTSAMQVIAAMMLGILD